MKTHGIGETARRALALTALVTALATPASAAEPDPRAAALAHFQVGLELIDRHAWDSALAEFSRSRELFATANALRNAAVCLRELHRYDEALDMYDELAARFGATLVDADRGAIAADVARITRYVGAVDVRSDPPGARVIVDGRDRGTTPLTKPPRVSVGTRAVRVVKDGYAPYETELTVASGETAVALARLTVVSRLGRLRVTEAEGRSLEALVDGTVVGMTPWEGVLVAGEHTIALRGPHDLGVLPAVVNVATGETKAVVLHAEALPGELQIEPTPSDARVLVDGRDVARGTWSGTLPSGVHGVEVGADWHATLAQSVVVSSRHPQSLRPILEPVPRAYVEFVAGFTLFAKTGVQGAASTCSSGCYGGVFGVRAGYKVTRRASLELAIADFQLPHDGVRTLSGTGSDGTPVVSTDYAESADAQLFFGGAAASYRFLEDTPITVRFLAGGARGFLNTSATGTVPYTFPGSGGETLASYGHPAFSRSFWTPAFGPEVRIGYRFASGIAVDAGLSLLFFFFPSTPSFTGQEPVIVTPPGPSFSGGLVYVVPLTVAVHFDL